MASNNESEYETLIVGLRKVKLFGAQHLIIHCDSQLVANQLTAKCATRNQMMETYMKLAQKLLREFTLVYIDRFPRTSNSHAYTLSMLASAVEFGKKRTIEVELLSTPCIDARQYSNMTFDIEADLGVCWM